LRFDGHVTVFDSQLAFTVLQAQKLNYQSYLTCILQFKFLNLIITYLFTDVLYPYRYCGISCDLTVTEVQ